MDSRGRSGGRVRRRADGSSNCGDGIVAGPPGDTGGGGGIGGASGMRVTQEFRGDDAVAVLVVGTGQPITLGPCVNKVTTVTVGAVALGGEVTTQFCAVAVMAGPLAQLALAVGEATLVTIAALTVASPGRAQLGLVQRLALGGGRVTAVLLPLAVRGVWRRVWDWRDGGFGLAAHSVVVVVVVAVLQADAAVGRRVCDGQNAAGIYIHTRTCAKIN